MLCNVTVIDPVTAFSSKEQCKCFDCVGLHSDFKISWQSFDKSAMDTGTICIHMMHSTVCMHIPHFPISFCCSFSFIILTGLPVVSLVIKRVWFFVVDQTKCVSHSSMWHQLMLIHSKMFDERMFRNRSQADLSGMHKRETINKLTSVQIAYDWLYHVPVCKYWIKLPVYKYKLQNK